MALKRSLLFFVSLLLVLLPRDVNSIDKPKPFVPGLIRRHGAFVEKWEGVDDVKIDYLLEDSRYPYLPTWTGYLSNFAQPSNWGDNFGSRIRTYFVPLQTGYHVFYLQSNNEGRLYLSPGVNEHHKSLIASISDVHFTGATDVNKYDEQKSYPILLQKGKYYYMESLMKEKFNSDLLDVAVKTPDGQMHVPITSEFLWTDVPDNVTSSSSSYHFLWKLTARSAARFGYAAGQSSGAINGAKAGAKAGAIAGKEYGAKVGAEAGRNIAKNIMTKAITLALSADPRSHSGVINLFTNTKGNIIVAKGAVTPKAATDSSSLVGSILGSVGGDASKTGTGGGGSSGAGGTGAVGAGAGAGTSVAASSSAAAAGGTASSSGLSQGSLTSSTSSSSVSQGGSSSGKSTGTNGNSSVNVSSYGPQSQRFSSSKIQAETVVTPFLPLNPDEKITPVGFLNTKYEIKQGSVQSLKIPAEAKPGEDPMVKARTAVNLAGFANKVYKEAYYKLISSNEPAVQANSTHNLCFQSVESKVSLTSFCHVFKIKEGLNNNYLKAKDGFALESACVPGYYLRQKNYKFVLAQGETTPSFVKTSTFRLYRQSDSPDGLEIRIISKVSSEWIICEAVQEDGIQQTHDLRIYAESDISKGKFAKKCSFYLQPLPIDESPLQNCKNVLDVSKPTLPGHKRKHQGLWEKSETKDLCVAVHFINKAGIPFEIKTDLSDEPYLIKQGNLRFKEVVKKPELHRLVIFRASDPMNKYKVLLSGGSEITVTPSPNCDDKSHYLEVLVTSKPAFQTQKEDPGLKAKFTSVHNHFHYHQPAPPPMTPTVCPSICTSGPVCPSTCSQACCKKDEVTYVEVKSKIGKMP